jgi:ubiquinone biosynthesis protein UbiJ
VTTICPTGAEKRFEWYRVSETESAKPGDLQDHQAVEYARDGYKWHIHNCEQCQEYLAEVNRMHDRTH